MKKLRCVLYARVSKPKPGAQDPENQLRQLREFAGSHGWALPCEYVDRESGSKADRFEFLEMMGDASRRAFDVLLFWSLDRFSREGIAPTLMNLKRLASYGVKCRSLQESWLDTTNSIAGDFVIACFAGFAEFERRRNQERTHAGPDRARAQVKRLGRPRVVFDRVKIRRMKDAGKSIREISDETGLSHGTVQRACEE